jgi:hypothetical protein
VAGFGYPALWLAATAAAFAVVTVRRGRQSRSPSAADVLACEAACAMVLSLAVTAQSQLLRDLDIYLRAGRHFLDGAPVYTTTPISAYPSDLGMLPFLYPPPVLPVFSGLAFLPPAVASIAWAGASAVAIVLALRRFGLPWRWIALLLAWTPVSQGLYVGNIAVPGLLLLALAPAAGGLLVAGALLKPQSGVIALWLVRERRWRALAIGLAGLVAIVAVTLPMTGVDMWRQWLAGLDAYSASQRLVPGLYGFGLSRYVPGPVALALGIGAIALTLRWSAVRGLGGLAWASAVASPSLWAHGFLVLVPALFTLNGTWLWFALALTSAVRGPGWVLALAVLPAAWTAAYLRRTEPASRDAAARALPAGTGWPGWQGGGSPAPIHPASGGRRSEPGLPDTV